MVLREPLLVAARLGLEVQQLVKRLNLENGLAQLLSREAHALGQVKARVAQRRVRVCDELLHLRRGARGKDGALAVVVQRAEVLQQLARQDV